MSQSSTKRRKVKRQTSRASSTKGRTPKRRISAARRRAMDAQVIKRHKGTQRSEHHPLFTDEDFDIIDSMLGL